MKKGFFENNNGDGSMMRLLSFIVVSVGCSCVVAEVAYSMVDKSYNNHLIELTAFVSLGLAAKWAQKKDEI